MLLEAMCYLRPFAFLLAVVLCAASQTSAQILPFQSYTVKNGLLTNDVQTLCQDSRGCLWVGTAEGISVYDGESFTNYTASDGVPPGFINHIISDRFASPPAVWVLCSSGTLSRFVDGQFREIPYEHKIGSGKGIITIIQDHSGTLWLGMENGLARLINGVVTPIASGFEMRFVDQLAEQGDSLIWVAARNTLLVYSVVKQSFAQISIPRHPKPDLAVLLPDQAGLMRVGLHDGYLLTFRGTAFIHERAVASLDFLVEDGEGSFWFGSYAGLGRIRATVLLDGPVERYTIANGLPENTLKVALIDREHSLWVGGISQGIARLSETGLLRFPIEGINPPYQFSIGTADSNGHLWVVSRFGLREFWRDASGAWKDSRRVIDQGNGSRPSYRTFDRPAPNPSASQPYSVSCDSKGSLWVGFSNAQLSCYTVVPTGKGPSRLGLIRSFTPGVDFPDAFPASIVVDRRGRVWYALGNGIVLLDPSKDAPCLRVFGARDGLPAGSYVRVLSEDGHGNIWAGTLGRGLARIAGDSALTGTFRLSTKADGLEGRSITSITEDAHDNVWVGTEVGGVSVFSDSGSTRLSTDQGFPSNRILSLIRGPDNHIWVGTPRGIETVEMLSPLKVRRIQELVGYSVCCGGTTRDGLLWFAAKDGLLIFDPRSSRRETTLSPAYITAFYVNGRPVLLRDSLSLSSGENNCAIRFIAPAFRDPEALRYQYRLAGIDANWHPPVSSTSANYPALPPGAYTFLVRTVRASDGQGGQQVSLSFVIVPPFWSTWWFRAFAIVALFGSVGGTFRYMEMRKMKRRIERLEQEGALERERSRISQDMHDEVGAGLTEIGILSELAKRNVLNPREAEMQMQRVSEASRETIASIGEIIWAINPKNDLLDDLVVYLRHYTARYLGATAITVEFDIPETIPDFHLSAEARRNIFLVVKEALHNIVKHSQATTVFMKICFTQRHLDVLVRDNGKGFSTEDTTRFGNGLHNMEKRMKSIGGGIVIQSKPGEGTWVAIALEL